jgi:hypothetical protein
MYNPQLLLGPVTYSFNRGQLDGLDVNIGQYCVVVCFLGSMCSSTGDRK